MSHTRLNSNHRMLLRELVAQIVTCPAEIKVEETAYQRALPVALEIIEKHFPAKDMAVLARYSVAENESDIKVQLVDGEFIQFNFREGDQPKIPKWTGMAYLATVGGGKILEHWKDASAALKQATRAKHTDYDALINSAATFEMVTDVWPEAMQLADRIRSNLPSIVSPEVLARIKADSKKRMKQAA